MKGKISVSTWIFLAVVALYAYVVLVPANSLMNWYTTDDAFYYFKTAQNFTEGYGLSFDGLGRSSGFHPLWMLICIPVFALARFDLILPLRILAFISILLTAGSSCLVYRILNRRLVWQVSLFFALFWAFSRQIYPITTMRGMEAGVSAFFLLLLIDLVQRYLDPPPAEKKKPALWLIGMVAALAIFSRLDNVFLAAVLGFWLVIPRGSFRSLALIDALSAAAAIFIHSYNQMGFGAVYAQYLDAVVWMALLSPVLRMTVYALIGLYGLRKPEPAWREWMRMLLGAGISSLLLTAAMFGLRAAGMVGGFARSVLVWDALSGFILLVGVRWISRLGSGRKQFIPQVPSGFSISSALAGVLRSSFQFAFPVGVSLGVYMLFNRAYFGVWMPVSGQIKHWWGSMITIYGRPTSSILEFLGIREDGMGGAWGLATWLPKSLVSDVFFWLKIDNDALYRDGWAGLTLVGTVFLFWLVISQRKHLMESAQGLLLLPIFAGCMVQVIQYTGTRYVNLRSWYWVGEMVLVVFCSAALADALFRRIAWGRLPRWAVKGIQWGLTGILLVNFGGSLLRDVPPVVSEKNRDRYLWSIRALEDTTLPGDVIGSSGGGVVAYLIKDRRIVNLDGLMNSAEYFRELQSLRLDDYFARIGLKYVYASLTVMTQSEPYVMIFPNNLIPLGDVGGSMLFRYVKP